MSAPVDTQHQGAPSDVCVEMEVLREAICKLCSITCPCTYITLCILVQPIAPQLKLAPGGNSLPEPACSHQHHMLTSPAFTPVSLLSPSTILQPFKGPFGQQPALTWVPQGPRLLTFPLQRQQVNCQKDSCSPWIPAVEAMSRGCSVRSSDCRGVLLPWRLVWKPPDMPPMTCRRCRRKP